jgi:hypothetical protein
MNEEVSEVVTLNLLDAELKLNTETLIKLLNCKNVIINEVSNIQPHI